MNLLRGVACLLALLYLVFQFLYHFAIVAELEAFGIEDVYRFAAFGVFLHVLGHRVAHARLGQVALEDCVDQGALAHTCLACNQYVGMAYLLDCIVDDLLYVQCLGVFCRLGQVFDGARILGHVLHRLDYVE